MRTVIDDLPHIGVSRLRAAGLIGPDDKTTVVIFPTPDAPTFVVALQHVHFRNGGGWSFFVCPCGRRCRALRLYNGSPPASTVSRPGVCVTGSRIYPSPSVRRMWPPALPPAWPPPPTPMRG